MILGRRRKTIKPQEEEQHTDPVEPRAENRGGDSVEQLLDTVAALLRTWGEFAFELESMDEATVREQFEGWARHALVATPEPGSDGGAPGAGPPERNWSGLQLFVRDHRESEQSHVRQSLADLREVIRAFVQTIGRATQEDRNTDRRMTGQLGKLQDAVGSNDTQAVKREALRSITLIENLIEVRTARQRSQMQQLSGRLERLNVELVDVREKLATDPLTKIHSRAAFDEHLRRVIYVQTVVGVPATLFMIDVDHFKWVNDRYGHPVGDTVLQEVGSRLQQGFRRRGDFVARFGGDEFAAIVHDTPSDGVIRICEAVLFAIRDMAVPNDGEPIRVSISVGAAGFGEGDDMQTWLERADRALYMAKEAGRDRFVVLDADADKVPETG